VSVEPSSTRINSNELKLWDSTLSIASAMNASLLRKIVIIEMRHTRLARDLTDASTNKKKNSPEAPHLEESEIQRARFSTRLGNIQA
jgi:hypothetical protein